MPTWAFLVTCAKREVALQVYNNIVIALIQLFILNLYRPTAVFRLTSSSELMHIPVDTKINCLIRAITPYGPIY